MRYVVALREAGTVPKEGTLLRTPGRRTMSIKWV